MFSCFLCADYKSEQPKRHEEAQQETMPLHHPQHKSIHRHLNSLLTTSTAAAFVALVLVTALLLCAIIYSDSSSSSVSSSSILRSLSAAVASAFSGQTRQSSGLSGLARAPSPSPIQSPAPSPAPPSPPLPIESRARWIYEEAYPIYDSRSCAFIDQGFRCADNGRPDLGYLKYRWSNLTVPDPAAVLRRLRDRRLVFVGDSIGRNQWESLLCILSSAVPDKSRIFEENGAAITKHTGFLSFRFQDYNLTVEYYRSPYLVPQTRPPRGSPRGVNSVLHVDLMDWTAPRWIGAKVLVFNAGHWWNYEKTLRGGCYFAHKGKVNVTMPVAEAYTRAIHAWGDWIRTHIDTTSTAVFFRSYSPVHFSNGTWRNGGQCDAETTPSEVGTANMQQPWTTRIIREVVERLPAVKFMDIGEMTDLRKDGHPSLYYQTPRAKRSKQDCSHWCLPGVPDTWNLMLLHELWDDL